MMNHTWRQPPMLERWTISSWCCAHWLDDIDHEHRWHHASWKKLSMMNHTWRQPPMLERWTISSWCHAFKGLMWYGGCIWWCCRILPYLFASFINCWDDVAPWKGWHPSLWRLLHPTTTLEEVVGGLFHTVLSLLVISLALCEKIIKTAWLKGHCNSCLT